MTFRQLDDGARVLPFRLFRHLRVSRVQGRSGSDLGFLQEGKDADADFGVIISANRSQAGKDYTLIDSSTAAADAYDTTPAVATSFLVTSAVPPGIRTTTEPHSVIARLLMSLFHYPKGNTVNRYRRAR